MPTNLIPFSLRIPEKLLHKIRVIAAYNKRSTNKEIEFAVEQYVTDYEKKHGLIKIAD